MNNLTNAIGQLGSVDSILHLWKLIKTIKIDW